MQSPETLTKAGVRKAMEDGLARSRRGGHRRQASGVGRRRCSQGGEMVEMFGHDR